MAGWAAMDHTRLMAPLQPTLSVLVHLVGQEIRMPSLALQGRTPRRTP
jgi:hypothetical protein